MDEVTLAKQSYHLILKDFGLEEVSETEEAKIAFDWLEDYLTRQVNYLLDHDFNRLLNALYRIDVSEDHVKKLIHDSSQSGMARGIAQAIIEREKQKVITRSQFRQS